MRFKALAFIFSAICFSLQANAAVLDTEAQVMSSGDAKSIPLSVTFFSIASVSNMTYNKSDKEPKSVTERSFGIYDYISLNYKIDGESKASMRIPFLYNTSGISEYGDQKSETFALSDLHFVYSNYDLGYIGDIDIAGNIKWYLPTSQYAQTSKMIAKIRFEGFFAYQIGRFSSIEYVVKPDIYIQSQTAFYNPDGIPQFDDGTFVRDPRSTTKQFGLEHYVQGNFDINKYFSFQTKTGFNEDWYHTSAAEDLEGNHVTSLRLGVGLDVRVMRGLTFTLLYQNDTKLNSYRGKDVSIWQPENTEYALMTNAFLF